MIAYYYTRDHLGSVREMTDSSGNIQARYDYDPYGRTTVITGTVPSDFQYAGYYAHQPSGLYLTMFRAYDPNTARWLSRDPLNDAETLQGPNLYEYALNDPANLTDPDGEFIPLLILAALGLWLADTEYANAPGPGDEIYSGTDFGPPQALAMIPDAVGVAAGAMALTKGISAASILRAAAAGKGNFGLGSACAKTADALGNAWVGPGARLASDGKTLISKDGLRQYRPPSSKPNSPYAKTGKQANFESRDVPKGPWQNNGHLDITN